METLPRSPWVLAILALVVLGEAAYRLWGSRRGYDGKAAAASFGVALGNILLKPVTTAVIGGAFLIAEHITPIHLSMSDWRVWLAGFVAVEFVYYWFHRWSHTVRWLWASHAVHHSANEFTLPAAIRLGWTNLVSGGWVLFLPLVLLGFPPLMVSALLAFNLTYQFFLHTEVVGRLGPLEWLLNTPTHHSVHHASNEMYLDRNFGGVLIIWDRLFGTFAAVSRLDPVRYGLTTPLMSNNPVTIALHEWLSMFRDMRRAQTWAARLQVALSPPGKSERAGVHGLSLERDK